jgi:two-component system sensor histidine kinase BaeS
MVLLFGLFAAGAMVMAIWAAAAIVGIVDAPPIVTAGGVVAFAIVIVGVLVVGRALRRMAAPLDDLIEASGRIEAGDYTARVAVSGSGDMRSLTRAFNKMSERLQASDERRRAFLADVTHELRTPLTVIQGQLEAIEDGVYEADAERVSALLTQARQMTGLVEDLHTISLAEVGALQLQPQPADLNAVAEEVVAGFAPAAELARVDLRAAALAEPVLANIDGPATRRVLGNLVSNALRHTSSGGSITLLVGAEGTSGHIEVADTGSGMNPAFAERAFDRFGKGPDSPGSGLGLAIARDLVEAQAGTITLTSTLGTGTRVRVAFPLSGADPWPAG